MPASDSYIPTGFNKSPWQEAEEAIRMRDVEKAELALEVANLRAERDELRGLLLDMKNAPRSTMRRWIGRIDAALAEPWEGAEHGEGRQRC